MIKKFITVLAVGSLALGSAFAEKGEKKEGDKKPRGERPEGKKPRPDGERPEGGRKKGGMKALDKNEDGKISFDEFKANPRAKDKPEEQVKAFFDKMDFNKDGFLSREDREARAKEGGDRPKRPEGGKKRPEGDKKKGDE